MLIHVEDLQKDDVILIPSSGTFRLYKVLAEPKMNPKTAKYSAVKCSTYVRHVESINPYSKRTMILTYYDPLPPDQHNMTVSINFRWKNIWLLHRETL